mgnify:CR=1 FL=1
MALRLIHTADWHLGQTFFGYDREAEHEAFLGFLTNLLVERQTDVLLIAGDVFDVTNPSAGAQRRFYRFLREANRLNPGLQIVIIAGNHDSAIRLEAPNPLLEELNTSIVGIVGRTDSGEIDLASLVIPLRNRAGEREALCLSSAKEITRRRPRESLIRMWRASAGCTGGSMPMRMPGGTPARRS